MQIGDWNYLYLFVAVAIAVAVLVYGIVVRQIAAQKFAAAKVRQQLIPNQTGRKILSGFLVLSSLALMVIAMLDIRCLLYTSPSPRDLSTSRMPSSA